MVRTIATQPEGAQELWREVLRHEAFLRESGLFASRRRARLEALIRQRVRERLIDELWRRGDVEKAVRAAVLEVEGGATGPYRAANEIVEMALVGR